MIPIFEDFLYPFLLSLKTSNLTKKEMRSKMKQYFSLTDEECLVRTKGGSTTQLNDRIGWAVQYFRRAKFIEIPQKGTYQITKRGRDYLNNNKTLKIIDLLEYEEFAEFSSSHHIVPKKKNEVSFIEKTPTETLESAYETINQSLREEILSLIINKEPSFFERLVVDLLVAMGYGGAFKDAATVTQYSKDGGIDGVIKEDKLGLDNIYIQAKRYSTDTVGKPQIQQFVGALDERKASKGVFITTSKYSKEARQYVEKASKKIVLIDGDELADYMIEYNVGVSIKKSYALKKIDTDYFMDDNE